MNMKPIFLNPRAIQHLGAGLALLLSVACSTDILPTQSQAQLGQNESQSAFDTYLEDFLPFIHFQERRLFTDMLGEPDSTHTEPVENTHVPGQQDLIETMSYQDLELTLYKIAQSDDEVMLLGLSLTGPEHVMKAGIRVGSALFEVTALLGQAQTRERQANAWVDSYCDTWTGQSCLYFHHDNTTIQKIVYESYFD